MKLAFALIVLSIILNPNAFASSGCYEDSGLDVVTNTADQMTALNLADQTLNHSYWGYNPGTQVVCIIAVTTVTQFTTSDAVLSKALDIFGTQVSNLTNYQAQAAIDHIVEVAQNQHATPATKAKAVRILQDAVPSVDVGGRARYLTDAVININGN